MKVRLSRDKVRASVEGVHGLRWPIFNDQLNILRERPTEVIDPRRFDGVKGGQDVVADLPMFGSANADPDPYKLSRPKSLYDRAKPIVTSVASTDLDSNLPKGKFKFIMNDDQFLRWNLKKLSARRYALSAEVHKGLRFKERDGASSFDGPLAEQSIKFLTRQVYVEVVGESIKREEAYVMSSLDVLRSWISKTNDQCTFHTRLNSKI
jgi:hypothetical protein